MDQETAFDVVSRLHHNNPRVVRADKAIAQIEAQRAAKIRLKEAADNPVIISTGDWYERRDELEEGMVFTTGGRGAGQARPRGAWRCHEMVRCHLVLRQLGPYGQHDRAGRPRGAGRGSGRL